VRGSRQRRLASICSRREIVHWDVGQSADVERDPAQPR
jgi:hypothetical protein